MLGHLGMHPDHLLPRHAYLATTIPIAGVAHQAGTCRFGTDPATSVLDVDCRAHEVDNLRCLPTRMALAAAVSPGFTLGRLHASTPAEPELAATATR